MVDANLAAALSDATCLPTCHVDIILNFIRILMLSYKQQQEIKEIEKAAGNLNSDLDLHGIYGYCRMSYVS